jgi:plastocyanin
MALTPKVTRAALAFAIAVGVCVGCENTMTGPGTATPTPTPGGPTPTPAPPRVVYVGRGEGGQSANAFVDSVSMISTSTIHAGDTVQWYWVDASHSTTSGNCPSGCVPDGLWDSGIGHDLTFEHTFPAAGTYPYFCLVHGTMMQGTVIVQ